MHLAYALIQSDLQCIQVISISTLYLNYDLVCHNLTQNFTFFNNYVLISWLCHIYNFIFIWIYLIIVTFSLYQL